MERLIRRRRECPEIGWGRSQLLDAGAPSLLAQRFDWAGRTMFVVHNLAREPRKVRLRFNGCDGWEGVTVIFGDGDAPTLRHNAVELELDAYGHCWLRVRRQGQRLLP
jgi:hypothetical protein